MNDWSLEISGKRTAPQNFSPDRPEENSFERLCENVNPFERLCENVEKETCNTSTQFLHIIKTHKNRLNVNFNMNV